jgi:hypothetical protein
MKIVAAVTAATARIAKHHEAIVARAGVDADPVIT